MMDGEKKSGEKTASVAGQTVSGGLEGLVSSARKAGGEGRRLPPVHLWDPPFCGEIDMRIARDGTWYYNGSPIGRPALVQLFSSILRKDADRYVLVTPVERVGIVVEDAPFLAVDMQICPQDHEHGNGAKETRSLRFRTQTEDWVRVDKEHPLRFEPGPSGGLKPYVLVRDELWALVKRSLFYDLVALGEIRSIDGVDMFGVTADGIFFPMARADEIDAM